MKTLGTQLEAGKLVLSQATGTAPLTVTSTTAVTNLNADLLDGNHASAFAASTHAHGNITSAGAIGSTANLPVITTTSGVLTTGSFGTGANTFCQGNDSRLSDARTPVSHDNTYHSATYITSSGVTYENLSANGDIGTGSAQVAVGNHTHSYAPLAFSTIAVSGQSNVVADSTGDTLTLIAGSNITITTDAGNDTITIAASGGSGFVSITNNTSAYIDIDTDNNSTTETFKVTKHNAATDLLTLDESGNLTIAGTLQELGSAISDPGVMFKSTYDTNSSGVVDNAEKVQGITFTTSATDPTGTDRLNAECYFHATKVYSAIYNDLAETMENAEGYCYEDFIERIVEVDDDGKLHLAQYHSYNTVGIVSNTYGFLLGKEEDICSGEKSPVAMAGTVWVKVVPDFVHRSKVGMYVIPWKEGLGECIERYETQHHRGYIVGKVIKVDKENSKVKVLVMNM